MSFISDRIKSLDSQLDRLQADVSSSETCAPHQAGTRQETARVRSLKRSIKQLTTILANSTPNALIPPARLANLLKSMDLDAKTQVDDGHVLTNVQMQYEDELEWLLVAKATFLVYGIIFKVLIEQTLPLSEDLFYWDNVLTSYRYTALYCLQTAPLTLFDFSKEIYKDASQKFRAIKEMEIPSLSTPVIPHESFSESFRKFYNLVSISTRERLRNVRTRTTMTSPFTIIRYDIRKHQKHIRRLRETQASALGILVGETLNFDTRVDHDQDWKSIVIRASFILESLTTKVPAMSKRLDSVDYQELILESLGNEMTCWRNVSTESVVSRLQRILQEHIPAHVRNIQLQTSSHGRPGVIIRYWLPATIFLFSSSRILGLISRKQAGLRTWVHETVITISDFWNNWVLDPTKKIIGTIRHDADSEVALMSRRSLAADMESLERMVVDFAIDNADVSSSDGMGQLQGQDLEILRQHVKEGDLTPVLKAYERDLRHPFVGALRGELVRALLIQIQKTKVDVEVAISGIDRLLKSQELVFGLVGVTPGLLATWAFCRWLAGIVGLRKGIKSGKISGGAVRVLRRIDMILTAPSASEGHESLSFKDHGLLLCELVILRELGRQSIPKTVLGEFVEDIEQLSNIHNGITRQRRIADRIRWVYGKWIY